VYSKNKQEITMRIFLIALAFIADPAYAINHHQPPQGVSVNYVDRELCSDLNYALMNQSNLSAFDAIWYKNSKNEYVSFQCFHLEYDKENIQYSYSIIYTASDATIKNQIKLQRQLKQFKHDMKLKRMENSGFL
jgi:hypothetical protein